MASKEGGGGKEIRIKLPDRVQTAIIIGLLGIVLALANKSVAVGLDFQVPLTQLHVMFVGAVGHKDRLHDPLPPAMLAKMGPNANRGIVDVNAGLNVGPVGGVIEFDIRNDPNGTIFDAGIGTSK